MIDRSYDDRPDMYTTGVSTPDDIERLVTDDSRTEALGVTVTTNLGDVLDELYQRYQREIEHRERGRSP